MPAKIEGTALGIKTRRTICTPGPRFESYRRDGASAGRLRHFIAPAPGPAAEAVATLPQDEAGQAGAAHGLAAGAAVGLELVEPRAEGRVVLYKAHHRGHVEQRGEGGLAGTGQDQAGVGCQGRHVRGQGGAIGPAGARVTPGGQHADLQLGGWLARPAPGSIQQRSRWNGYVGSRRRRRPVPITGVRSMSIPCTQSCPSAESA